MASDPLREEAERRWADSDKKAARKKRLTARMRQAAQAKRGSRRKK